MIMVMSDCYLSLQPSILLNPSIQAKRMKKDFCQFSKSSKKKRKSTEQMQGKLQGQGNGPDAKRHFNTFLLILTTIV